MIGIMLCPHSGRTYSWVFLQTKCSNDNHLHVVHVLCHLCQLHFLLKLLSHVMCMYRCAHVCGGQRSTTCHPQLLVSLLAEMGLLIHPGEYCFFLACSIMNARNLPVSASCSIGLLSYTATCNILCGCGCWSSDIHAFEPGTPQMGSFPLPSSPHRHLKSNALSSASLFSVLIC